MTSADQLRERLQRQREEALSPENRWCAGVALGHSPTDEEALRHYILNGGAKGFAEREKRRQVLCPA